MDRNGLDNWLADRNRRTLVMGILNVTPDSFSDGGKYIDAEAAFARAMEMSAAGAAIIDIGGESTRPGSEPVDEAEQIRRIVPVIQQVAERLPVLVSVDTTSATVAEQALDAGAGIINDISAGRFDPDMLPLAAARRVPVILMHMLGEPRTMQVEPKYVDVVAEVAGFLREHATVAKTLGVGTDNILVDPGIGFGKSVEHNLALLRRMDVLCDLGYPLVIGTSRKRFIGQITGEVEAEKRVMGTAATVAWAVANGAAIVRVHDVAEMSQVVKMTEAIVWGAAP